MCRKNLVRFYFTEIEVNRQIQNQNYFWQTFPPMQLPNVLNVSLDHVLHKNLAANRVNQKVAQLPRATIGIKLSKTNRI